MLQCSYLFLTKFDVKKEDHRSNDGPPYKRVAPAPLLVLFFGRQRQALLLPDQSLQFFFRFTTCIKAYHHASRHAGPENNTRAVVKRHLREEIFNGKR